MPDMARRVADFGTTVFAEITALARECGAINLGQGFPDFDGPPPVLQAAIDAVNRGLNQYPPGIGFPQVREAVAGHARRFYDQIVDPATEVLVTAGATEAIFAAILGLTDPGDEVIVFAPTYDSYIPNMTMAGVSPRIVYMNPPDWNIDPDELTAAFTPRTRAVIVNTPHNPTGKVYSRDELTLIADLCQRHDVIAITDEVYEHLVYDGGAHVRLATLPGMAERTLTISSLGKTFSVTGWKVGWAIGPRALVTGANRAHQFITYAVASPLQAAAAAALALPDAYYAALRDDFQMRRDFMIEALEAAGFRTIRPQGGYFILAEWTGIPPEGAHIETDEQFARWLTCEVGVAAIPPSAFYAPAEKRRVRHLIRFAACKKDDTLRAAAEKLAALRR